MKLINKTAIITGAAEGIGRATALLFAQEGAGAVVTDINEEKGQLTADEINRQGGKAIFVKHDISLEKDWQNVVEKSLDAFGSIDILFNNAGIFLIKPLIDTTLEEWNTLMGVNVTGVFLGMKSVIPVMQRQGKGSIINNSSTAGLIGSKGVALYGTTKAAIRSLSKHAALEYGSDNIRINVVFPGFVNTKMIAYRAEIDKTNQEQQRSTVPLGRIADPEDIAKTVLFLASDDSSYLAGAEIIIDGGKSLGINRP